MVLHVRGHRVAISIKHRAVHLNERSQCIEEKDSGRVARDVIVIRALYMLPIISR